MSVPEPFVQEATQFEEPNAANLHKVHTATAKPKPALTEEEWANMDKPKVLIVGAGIGGLMLGQLLHRGGIPFEIFERAKEVKPLGSAMSLGSSVATLFKQLGIYDELVKIGKTNIGWTGYYKDKPLYTADLTARLELCGAEEYIVARPDLYDLLLRQIPKEKLHMNKKVLNFLQNDLGTMIRCHDGSSYHGDILVGADGAYSAVRQHLYKVLKEKNKLPKSDDVALPFDNICLVGQTQVLDPEEFPELKLPHSQFRTMIEGANFLTYVFTTKNDTICWSVVQYLNNDTLKDHDAFRNSEWGPEAAESMCKQVRHFKVPCGKDENMTLGELIDRTPKNLISKVMLEEKVFDTWYGGRTVLLGDACHKLNPAGGAGAIAAIHGAVTLANWICSLETKNMDDFERIFKEYKHERLPPVLYAASTSKALKKGSSKTLTGAFIRLMYRQMPGWLWRNVLIKAAQARPQAAFLPLQEDTGTVPQVVQPSLEKTLPIFLARIEKQKKLEAEADAHVRSENLETSAVTVNSIVAV
ncbi:hypothetical protein BG004_001696 [Podila humilis]|nr:hypothetical protein BG004_001696 [Podila humilis]